VHQVSKLLFSMRFIFFGLRHTGKLAMVRVMVTLEAIFPCLL